MTEEADKTLAVCPVCRTKSLVEHCKGGHCQWHHCRHKPCDALLNLGTRRGHALAPDGIKRERIRLL